MIGAFRHLDLNMFSTIFGGLVLLATIASAYDRYIARRDGPGSSTWPSTPGRISTCQIIEGNGHIGKPDSGWLSYSYTVNGTSYIGKNVTLNDGTTEPYRFVLSHSVGQDVTVYYDPKNHSRSILTPGNDNELFGLGSIGTVLFWLSQVILIMFGVMMFFAITYTG
jgi:Protein of unknown function (DUF3592)